MFERLLGEYVYVAEHVTPQILGRLQTIDNIRYLFGDNEVDYDRPNNEERRYFGGQAEVCGPRDRDVALGIVTCLKSRRSKYSLEEWIQYTCNIAKDHVRDGGVCIIPCTRKPDGYSPYWTPTTTIGTGIARAGMSTRACFILNSCLNNTKYPYFDTFNDLARARNYPTLLSPDAPPRFHIEIDDDGKDDRKDDPPRFAWPVAVDAPLPHGPRAPSPQALAAVAAVEHDQSPPPPSEHASAHEPPPEPSVHSVGPAVEVAALEPPPVEHADEPVADDDKEDGDEEESKYAPSEHSSAHIETYIEAIEAMLATVPAAAPAAHYWHCDSNKRGSVKNHLSFLLHTTAMAQARSTKTAVVYLGSHPSEYVLRVANRYPHLAFYLIDPCIETDVKTYVDGFNYLQHNVFERASYADEAVQWLGIHMYNNGLQDFYVYSDIATGTTPIERAAVALPTIDFIAGLRSLNMTFLGGSYKAYGPELDVQSQIYSGRRMHFMPHSRQRTREFRVIVPPNTEAFIVNSANFATMLDQHHHSRGTWDNAATLACLTFFGLEIMAPAFHLPWRRHGSVTLNYVRSQTLAYDAPYDANDHGTRCPCNKYITCKHHSIPVTSAVCTALAKTPTWTDEKVHHVDGRKDTRRVSCGPWRLRVATSSKVSCHPNARCVDDIMLRKAMANQANDISDARRRGHTELLGLSLYVKPSRASRLNAPCWTCTPQHTVMHETRTHSHEFACKCNITAGDTGRINHTAHCTAPQDPASIVIQHGARFLHKTTWHGTPDNTQIATRIAQLLYRGRDQAYHRTLHLIEHNFSDADGVLGETHYTIRDGVVHHDVGDNVYRHKANWFWQNGPDHKRVRLGNTDFELSWTYDHFCAHPAHSVGLSRGMLVRFTMVQCVDLATPTPRTPHDILIGATGAVALPYEWHDREHNLIRIARPMASGHIIIPKAVYDNLMNNMTRTGERTKWGFARVKRTVAQELDDWAKHHPTVKLREVSVAASVFTSMLFAAQERITVEATLCHDKQIASDSTAYIGGDTIDHSCIKPTTYFIMWIMNLCLIALLVPPHHWYNNPVNIALGIATAVIMTGFTRFLFATHLSLVSPLIPMDWIIWLWTWNTWTMYKVGMGTMQRNATRTDKHISTALSNVQADAKGTPFSRSRQASSNSIERPYKLRNSAYIYSALFWIALYCLAFSCIYPIATNLIQQLQYMDVHQPLFPLVAGRRFAGGLISIAIIAAIAILFTRFVDCDFHTDTWLWCTRKCRRQRARRQRQRTQAREQRRQARIDAAQHERPPHPPRGTHLLRQSYRHYERVGEVTDMSDTDSIQHDELNERVDVDVISNPSRENSQSVPQLIVEEEPSADDASSVSRSHSHSHSSHSASDASEHQFAAHQPVRSAVQARIIERTHVCVKKSFYSPPRSRRRRR
jgi:hypothetical protein